jgi:uncharacterized protein (DUF2141 family)
MKNLPIIFLFLIFSFSGLAQQSELTLVFENIKKPVGQIMVSLNNEKGEMIKGVKVPVKQKGQIRYTFQVKPGNYTLAAFHDENEDEKLNTSLVGIPTEAYGFSNNARGTFGPPSLKDQLFVVKGDAEMRITLK